MERDINFFETTGRGTVSITKKKVKDQEVMNIFQDITINVTVPRLATSGQDTASPMERKT